MSDAAIKNDPPHDTKATDFKQNFPRTQSLIKTVSDSFLAVILFGELVVLFGTIILRSVFDISFIWTEELASLLLVTLTFIGGAVAYNDGVHLSVRFLVDRLSHERQALVDAVGTWIIIGMSSLCIFLAVPVIIANLTLQTVALDISKSWFFAPFLAGMVLLIFFALMKMIEFKVRTILVSLLIVVPFLCIWFFMQNATGPWGGIGGYLFAGILLIIAIAMGLPIGFGLPIVAAFYLVSSKAAGASGIFTMPIAMTNGVSGFIMLAIPFFILAGDLMSEGGQTKPLADWVIAMVGHLRGGMLQVLVICMFIFSGISGSKVADVCAVGTTMRGMLKKQGYPTSESSAVLAASAIMGETIPPSLPLLVVGSLTTVSVGTLFLAGVVPAVFMAVMLMIFIYIKGWKNNWSKGDRFPFREKMITFVRACPILIVPLMLVIGITGGIATPTEVSSAAVVYAIALSLLYYKKTGIRDMVRIFSHSGVVAGMILFTISGGALFSWSMTVAGLPHLISAFINYLGGSSSVFLIFSLIVLVILGGVLEGLPALLVTVPLMFPIASEFGINLVHYSIVLIFAMGMGCFLPPFGIGFYVCCSIGESPSEKVTPALMPYIVVLLIGLILVTFVPSISLIVPKFFSMVH